MSADVGLERLRERTPAVDASVAAVMAQCGDYCETVYGRRSNESDLQDFFHVAIPGIAPEDVHCYALRAGDEVIGIAGMLFGWKRPGQSMIGLLASPHGDSMRIGIVETNTRAFAFWHALGYRETGERRAMQEFRGDVVLLEKAL